MKKIFFWISLILPLFILIFLSIFPEFLGSLSYSKDDQNIIAEVIGSQENKENKDKLVSLPPLDTEAYDKKLNELANNTPPKLPTTPPSAPLLDQGGEGGGNSPKPTPAPPSLWPVKTAYPNAGAILPFSRIIAYYGNLYSTRMGVLGQYPEKEMLERLDTEVKKWEVADPATPVIPALHYIAVVAQLSPGSDGKHRARMPDSEIDKVLAIANKIGAIVFLDIQVGFSNLQTEVPHFEKYLKLPNVHLGVDAEFSMKTGIRPGKVVGTLDATDLNFTTNYLAKIVKENNLTPKIFVVHRYTQKMITNYKMIKTLPEVQIVMHMDGWGGAAKKKNTYQQFIYKEPVQFTGFKLFYKNDILTPGTILMTPNDLLKLSPQPSYIQYQ